MPTRYFILLPVSCFFSPFLFAILFGFFPPPRHLATPTSAFEVGYNDFGGRFWRSTVAPSYIYHADSVFITRDGGDCARTRASPKPEREQFASSVGASTSSSCARSRTGGGWRLRVKSVRAHLKRCGERLMGDGPSAGTSLHSMDAAKLIFTSSGWVVARPR